MNEQQEKRFRESVMAQYYGACFECCDFEKMTNEYIKFTNKCISEALAEKEREVLYDVLGALNSFKGDTLNFTAQIENTDSQHIKNLIVKLERKAIHALLGEARRKVTEKIKVHLTNKQ